jgi:hypothetical protein
MKRTLQTLAAVLAFAVVVVWAGKGAHTGWTKNKEQIKTIDPVTEIEQVEWKKVFVPGLDFLGVGLFSAAALAVAARFIRKTANQ